MKMQAVCLDHPDQRPGDGRYHSGHPGWNGHQTVEEPTMDFLRLAGIDDFSCRPIRSFTILGRKIGIFKREDGTFRALEAGCKHQGADLTAGRIENNVATCPRHGWKYDLATGQCLNHDSPSLRKHDLKIIGNDIHVSLQPIE